MLYYCVCFEASALVISGQPFCLFFHLYNTSLHLTFCPVNLRVRRSVFLRDAFLLFFYSGLLFSFFSPAQIVMKKSSAHLTCATFDHSIRCGFFLVFSFCFFRTGHTVASSPSCFSCHTVYLTPYSVELPACPASAVTISNAYSEACRRESEKKPASCPPELSQRARRASRMPSCVFLSVRSKSTSIKCIIIILFF